MKKNKLEATIKQSGEQYFYHRTAHLQFRGPLPVKVKRLSWRSLLLWGTPTLTFGLTITVFVSILLGATQPNGSLPQAFTGIQALNQVSFPPFDQRDQMQKDFLMDAAYAQYREKINAYFQRTSLSLFDTDDNVVYSPLSAYAALSLLVEAAQGDTLSDLMALMQITDLASLRQGAAQAFIDTYSLTSTTVNASEPILARSQMANGVFVREDIAVQPDYLFRLANDYFAEVFHTTFDDDGLTDITRWLNQRTFDFLSMQPDDLSLDRDTALTLFNTLYLKANWRKAFVPLSQTATFTNTVTGQVQSQVTYMQKETLSTLYLDQPGFTLGVDQAFGDFKVVYVLPKGDLQPLDLLTPTYFPSIAAAFSEHTINESIRLTVPMTTTANKIDLKAHLLSVYPAIDSLFNPQRADLTNALPNAYLQSLMQHVKIEFNPAGMEAAAITEANVGVTSGPTPARVQLTLDRSYLYFIVNAQGLLLFTGLVNQPTR